MLVPSCTNSTCHAAARRRPVKNISEEFHPKEHRHWRVNHESNSTNEGPAITAMITAVFEDPPHYTPVFVYHLLASMRPFRDLNLDSLEIYPGTAGA